MTQQQREYYKPELSALRLVAFMLVFIHHALPYYSADWGEIAGPRASALFAIAVASCSDGVCLFFFLSAFLLTTLLLFEQDDTGTIHIRNFYLRRILRIGPLYIVGLGIGVGIALAHHDAGQLAMFAWYGGFIGNWYFQGHAWNPNPMVPLWSISVEMQCYLVLPVAMHLLSRRAFIRVTCALATMCMASLWWQGSRHQDLSTAIWTNSFSQSLFFAFGILLAVFLKNRVLNFSLPVRAMLALSGFLSFFIAGFNYLSIQTIPAGAVVLAVYLLVALGCTLLLVSFLDIRCHVPKRLVYLGTISYGLYVFHLLVMKLLGNLFFSYLAFPPTIGLQISINLASLPVIIILAALSYHYIERPFLGMKKRFQPFFSEQIIS